ncbi:MAG: ATP-dependent helicase [Leptospiraceae bacterium]|nr:ATP-dependent helicase [Leptospiraceae bacterium]
MKISNLITEKYPSINDDQKKIIEHDNGPLLVIAGPGSGKTFSIVLRAINLILNGLAKPSEIILCTFTEKAAGEMKDRIAVIKRKIGYKEDTSELTVGTIHSVCNSILMANRHQTSFGNNYDTLDDLTQLLFINEHFQEIFGEEEGGLYCGKWKTKWTTIEGARDYFNKITEELIDPENMYDNSENFIRKLGQAYYNYETLLKQNNKIDLSYLQKITITLLGDSQIKDRVTAKIKYLMIDEYQDTNFVQEQILLSLVSKHNNICVVGDEDQSLYRFRGATVRNILEFSGYFPDTKKLYLTTNYRSHENIVYAYDTWMDSPIWTEKTGKQYRFDKTIEPDPKTEHKKYPAVFSIWGKNEKDEAARFANLVHFLKANGTIKDYNQVALLLRSVKYNHSGRYIEALEAKGIPAFCPRARTYFENEEIQIMVGCFAILLGYYGEARGNVSGRTFKEFIEYIDQTIILIGQNYPSPHPLSAFIQKKANEISQLKESEKLDRRLTDYIYELLAVEPFHTFIKNENRARNLATLSELLNVFQNYYHYSVLTRKNRDYLKFNLFNSFLKLLYEGGINEYEDPYSPFPSGHVQILTIHQSKGLEFPVVVVGSLDSRISSGKDIDNNLEQFYLKPRYEPLKKITDFDRMRLFYVAFSRAEKILCLTCPSEPNDYFDSIWHGLEQWPYVEKDLLAAQEFKIKEKSVPRKSYSFTSDIMVYETCPRQYQYYKDYDFTPSRSVVLFFGQLVHQSIEEIHRIVLDGNIHTLNETKVEEIFHRTFHFLKMSSDAKPPGEDQKQSALRQVLNYYRLNANSLHRVIETEVDVSIEKEGYILNGKIDLLLGEDGKLELLDFKTSAKGTHPSLIKKYEDQLSTYAHILETRHGKRPDRLLLYWTSEETLDAAIQEFTYKPEQVKKAGEHFDSIVSEIQSRNYEIQSPPEAKICRECDFRHVCKKEKIIG